MEHEKTAVAPARPSSLETPALALAAKNTIADQASLLLLKVIADLETKQRQIKASELNSLASDETARAVHLFFDSIAGSEEFGATCKSLIALLQMPVLKSVEKSDKFFSDARHPARRLIKAIYQKTSKIDSVSDLKQAQIYAKLLDILNDVVREYKGDERIFLNAYFQVCQLADLP